MPTERRYTLGDRVVFLGRGPERGVQALQNYPQHSYDREGLIHSPFSLIEGVITEVSNKGELAVYAGKKFPNQAYARYVGPDGELWSQGYKLSAQYYEFLVEAYHNGARHLEWDEGKIQWVKRFLYPLVVTSAGYNKMLMDLAEVVRPNTPHALRLNDMEEIKAKAQEFGLPFAPFPDQKVSTKWALEDRVIQAVVAKPKPYRGGGVAAPAPGDVVFDGGRWNGRAGLAPELHLFAVDDPVDQAQQDQNEEEDDE